MCVCVCMKNKIRNTQKARDKPMSVLNMTLNNLMVRFQ